MRMQRGISIPLLRRGGRFSGGGLVEEIEEFGLVQRRNFVERKVADVSSEEMKAAVFSQANILVAFATVDENHDVCVADFGEHVGGVVADATAVGQAEGLGVGRRLL